LQLSFPASLLGGLRLLPRDWSAAGKAIAASIVGVTLFILILDGVIFRHALPPGYVELYTSPLIPRTPTAFFLSAVEEVKYRLLLMTALVMLMSLWRKPLPPLAFIAAILISQFVNVGALVIAFPIYSSLRFWLIGCVWGWLYWRHGWLAALIAHPATHIVLDPLLAQVLLHS
jgi:hypothetical protein